MIYTSIKSILLFKDNKNCMFEKCKNLKEIMINSNIDFSSVENQLKSDKINAKIILINQ